MRIHHLPRISRLLSGSALVVALLLGHARARATEPTPPLMKSPLTLDEALRLAQTENLDLRAARARLRQSEEASAKAWSAYLPSVDAGASYTRNAHEASFAVAGGYVVRDLGTPQGPAFDPSRPVSADNPPGAQTTEVAVPVDVRALAIQRRDQWSVQATLSQAIIAPGPWVAIKNAYLVERVAALTTENLRREILFGVARAYLGAASLKETVAVQAQMLEVRKRFERDAMARYAAGVVPKLAVLRSEIDRSRAEQDLIRSEKAYAAAKSGLAVLIGREPDFDVVTPAGELARSPGDSAMSTEDDTSFRERPDLLSARVNVDLAIGQRAGVRARYLPSVFFTANDTFNSVAGFSGYRNAWRLGVTLSWNLFDGGLREAQLREASARVLEAEASRDAAAEKARDELRRARLDLDSAAANRVKAREQLTLARENAELAHRNFEAGVSTYLEVADANAALASASLGALAEDLNVRLARLSLQRQLGTFAAAGGTPAS